MLGLFGDNLCLMFLSSGGAWGKKQGMKGEAVGAWAGEMGEHVQLNKRHIGIM